MIETIVREVERLKKKFGETDPRNICKALGIKVRYVPMGKSPKDCKGFFLRHARTSVIVVNSDLPEDAQWIVLFHELGHAVLHGKLQKMTAFHDFSLFENTSVHEYEANLFAAEYCLADEDVLELLNNDTFFFSAASELRVPPELLDFKFRILKRKGYCVVPPLMASSNFLKNMEYPKD